MFLGNCIYVDRASAKFLSRNCFGLTRLGALWLLWCCIPTQDFVDDVVRASAMYGILDARNSADLTPLMSAAGTGSANMALVVSLLRFGAGVCLSQHHQSPPITATTQPSPNLGMFCFRTFLCLLHGVWRFVNLTLCHSLCATVLGWPGFGNVEPVGDFSVPFANDCFGVKDMARQGVKRAGKHTPSWQLLCASRFVGSHMFYVWSALGHVLCVMFCHAACDHPAQTLTRSAMSAPAGTTGFSAQPWTWPPARRTPWSSTI